MRTKSDTLEIPGLQVDSNWEPRSRDDVLVAIRRLQVMRNNGAIGGEVMPEDVHPKLPPDSADHYHYFTLCMALNYQRNSYALWHAATLTYTDLSTRSVFRPHEVMLMDDDTLRSHLMKYKVALQPNRHVQLWRTLCTTLCDLLEGDVRTLFQNTDSDVTKILNYVQHLHKKRFPYLCGPKICNYWLFVMDQYTSAILKNRDSLSVAPDTHVIQASIKIGLIHPELKESPQIQSLVNEAWAGVLCNTEFAPIDVHTPLWLWSRSRFVPIEG